MFDLVSAPAKALARSGFGDIAIAVPDGTYAVDAKTGFGDVKVSGIATDDGAPRVISGRSSYGDVAIASR